MGSVNPEHLTPTASLNRVPIVELPGVTVPAGVRGRTFHDVLSARAVADLVRERADALRLGDMGDAEPAALLPRFDRCFVDDDARVRAAADAVAGQVGRRLGYLILTLRRGDAASRRARPDWDDGYWAHWAAISAIYVAGGLVGGELGPRLVEHSIRTLVEAGMTECAVRRASWPAILPLIGAARSAPPDAEAAVVFDFGQSFVKRACASYASGALRELRPLPSLPAPRMSPPADAGRTAEDVSRLAEFMVSVMAGTWRDARALGHPIAPTLIASFASYVRDGQPLTRQGGPYASLATASDNLARWLSGRLSDRLGQPLAVVLLHDGTAAARAYAGEPHPAVITLGTALGVGFPSSSRGLRSLAPEFAVAEPPPALG